MTRLVAWLLPAALLVPVVTPLWGRWQLACREPTFTWPIGGLSDYVLRADAYGSGAFGSRRRGGGSHNGIDVAAPIGTQVRAAKSGTARHGRQRDGMGTYLEVHHHDGSVALYGHLSRMVVADGQWVSRGQVIGLVGKSGNARPRRIHPHLHFELRLRGVPLDPLDGYLDGTEVSRSSGRPAARSAKT